MFEIPTCHAQRIVPSEIPEPKSSGTPTRQGRFPSDPSLTDESGKAVAMVTRTLKPIKNFPIHPPGTSPTGWTPPAHTPTLTRMRPLPHIQKLNDFRHLTATISADTMSTHDIGIRSARAA
jgi:hypothetical protein